MSAKRLANKLGLPEQGGDNEAALLFSSGSTGEPKGVVLTHRNILGNVRQVEDCGVMPENETLLGYLPIFHSFGFTVTIWFPLITGVRLVTLPSPLEVKRIGEVVREEQVTVLLGTPTFYRPYFTKVKKEDLQSLKFVIAGAEKTPEGFAQKWEETFGSRYLEGYGLTETSPVVSVNLPREIDRDGRKVDGRRPGSVGPLFPGLSARILHPETMEELPLDQQGILALRGPNIFPGYLRDEARTAEMFRDGWLVTGDLARFDDEGFLYIEGRLSRFSKIAGEMVPHGTVETYIAQTFGWMEEDKPQVAVASVKDEAKGEALVVFTIREIDTGELRNRLIEAGLPNLWVPRIIKVVEEIPTLATGKLDLKALREMAESL